METVSLNQLLEQYNAPNKIDYISIDTEGAEFEIINRIYRIMEFNLIYIIIISYRCN